MTLLKWLERHFEELICCVLIAVIATCVFTQVLARYLFSTALTWTEEIAAISMVWAVYMGAALCVRERFHVRIMVGVKVLPARVGQVVIVCADVAWAFFCLLMLGVGWDYLGVAWTFPEFSPSLGLNQFWPQTIFFLGYGLMLVRLGQQYLIWCHQGCHGLPGVLDEDSDGKQP